MKAIFLFLTRPWARWSLCGAYAAALAWGSLSASPAQGAFWPRFPHADKAAHFLAYLFFGLLLLRAIQARTTVARASAAFIAAAYGVMLEAIQPAASAGARECSALDMAANAAGAAGAAWAWAALRRRKTVARRQNTGGGG